MLCRKQGGERGVLSYEADSSVSQFFIFLHIHTYTPTLFLFPTRHTRARHPINILN